MRKQIILSISIILIMVTTPLVSSLSLSFDISINSTHANYSEKEMIDEYTWAVLRYDEYFRNQVNNNLIKLSSPADGPIMVNANFMSPEVCRVALLVYNETENGTLNKYQTLKNLAEYAEKTMVFSVGDIPTWGPPSDNLVVHRTIAHEGALCAKYSNYEQVKFIGGCYSQSSFCTAVLRLCGFKPEEVLNVFVSGMRTYLVKNNNSIEILENKVMNHVVNLVNVDDSWYVMENAIINSSRGRLFSEYRYGIILIIPGTDYQNATKINRIFLKDSIHGFDNDYYRIGDGWGQNDFCKLFSNMEKEQLKKLFEGVFSTFVFAKMSPLVRFRLLYFAKPHEALSDVYLPYTVKDTIGETIDEKAEYLSQLNRDFILDHKSDSNIPNQYDKTVYAYGLINVTFPQVYANAARLSVLTSLFGYANDTDDIFEDVNKTINWMREKFEVNQTVNQDQVAFSDLTYNIKNGSTLDQAVFAYGAIRNMRKDDDFWPVDDLFVLVTNNNEGYLAVNLPVEGWVYLNFGEGLSILKTVENICLAFNEEVKLDDWDK